jgi:hypothetical protein
MLQQILAEFQQTRTPLCLDELSRKLGIESSALEGMLQTLVRGGRLVEFGPASYGCVTCPAKGGCVILTNGVQKSYFLPPRSRAKSGPEENHTHANRQLDYS